MTNGLFIGFVVFVLVLIGYAAALFASRSRRAQEHASQQQWRLASRELEAEELLGRRVRQPMSWADSPAIIQARPAIIVEDSEPDLVGGVVNAMVAEEIIDSLDISHHGYQPDFTPVDPAPSYDPGPGFDGGLGGFGTGSSSGFDSGGFGGDGGSF